MQMLVGADNDQLTTERGTSSDRGRHEMTDGRDARPHSLDDDLSAWLAEYGHLPKPAAVPARRSTDPTLEAPPDGRPEAEFLLRLSAQKLFAEGRANPIAFQCVTWLGVWCTDDRVTWRTADDAWLAQLERSHNRRHLVAGHLPARHLSGSPGCERLPPTYRSEPHAPATPGDAIAAAAAGGLADGSFGPFQRTRPRARDVRAPGRGLGILPTAQSEHPTRLRLGAGPACPDAGVRQGQPRDRRGVFLRRAQQWRLGLLRPRGRRRGGTPLGRGHARPVREPQHRSLHRRE
jgi:hypothetical protein